MAHQTEKPDLWHARDNLKFKKMQNPDTTEYRAEYVKKNPNLPEKKLKEVLRKNNVDGHIKNLLGNKDNLPENMDRDAFKKNLMDPNE